MAVSNEPPQITGGGENPDNFSHRDIYDKFHPLNPENAHAAAQNYRDLADGWSSAASFFAARIRQSSSAAWQGAAADASRMAIANYATRAEDLTDALNAMASQVGGAIDGIVGTQHGVDAPNTPVGRWNMWDGDFLWHHGSRSNQKISEAQNAAREAMRDHYVTNFVRVDSQIPVIPKPNEIGDPLYTFTPPGTTGTPSGPAGNPSDPGSPGSVPGNGPGPRPGGAPDTGSRPDNPSGLPASTSPAGVQPPSTPSLPSPPSSPMTTPSGLETGAPTTVPSGLGLPDTGPGDRPTGGPNPNITTAPGKSVPGTTPETRMGNPAAAAARVGAGPGGMAGMGGLGGENNGRPDDVREHQLPEWLRNMKNTEELLGRLPKTVPGGVIGGNEDQDPNAGA